MKQLFQKFKGYAFTALVCLVLGIIFGFILDKPQTKYLAGKTITEYRDTCVMDKLIADVITETTTKESGGIRKGKPQKESSTLPIVETSKQDSTYTTVFSKSYNTGLMRMKVTTTVKAKSQATGKIDMEYELDTVTLKQMTTIVNTVVVQKDSTDKVPDQIVKYLPQPLDGKSKQGTWFNVGGSMNMNSKNQLGFDVGGGIRFNHTHVNLFKDPTTQFKSLEGWKVQINQEVFRLSRK